MHIFLAYPHNGYRTLALSNPPLQTSLPRYLHGVQMHELEQGGDKARSVSNGLTALSIAYYPGNDSIERAQAGEAEFKPKRSSASVDILLG